MFIHTFNLKAVAYSDVPLKIYELTVRETELQTARHVGIKVKKRIRGQFPATSRLKPEITPSHIILKYFHLRLLCGAGVYPLNVLQPIVAYCTNPTLVFPFHLQSAPRQMA
jgi:hypothetical protein